MRAERLMIVNIEIIGVKNLKETIRFLRDEIDLKYEFDLTNIFQLQNKSDIDLKDVKGQAFAKRALEVAACGNHKFRFTPRLSNRADAAVPEISSDRE